MSFDKIPKIISNKNLTEKNMEIDEAISEMRDVGLFRTDSLSSCSESSTAEVRRELKKKRKMSPSKDGECSAREDEGTTVCGIERMRKEREFLEAFLFNENNKVSKSVMKMVMSKWNLLENELYKAVAENIKLKTKVEEIEKNRDVNKIFKLSERPTFADALNRGPQITGRSEGSKQVQPHVVLIRPLEDGDKRSNVDIRNDLCKELRTTGSKVKIKGIRQMRKNGIIVEVDGNKDVEMINGIKLDGIGLKAEKPKKQRPLLMIYDIEKDMTKDDILEDLILKNMDIDKNETQFTVMREQIKIVHMFNIKNTDRSNALIETNATIYNKLINKNRIYIGWRTHRIKEYINVTRCYRCFGYGHAAKNCRLKSQLCEKCGEEGHVKEKCKEASPVCVNCKRNRRKDIKHEVKSPLCPVHLRQVEIYKDRIDWS